MRKKQRKIYLTDEQYKKFIEMGGVKILEKLLNYNKFTENLIIETDEDGCPIF